MKKKRVLSGIRATGSLHLGNYLGAVKGMLALQHDSHYETLYMVADVHGITTPYDPANINHFTRAVITDYLAVGLDPEKSILFVQSMIGEHLELAFYFSSVMTIARMQHLPTFKEKVKQHPTATTMALLNYPLLMAADILIYKTHCVPVGIDQEPHLEIAREIARKMNSQYGLDFPEPVRFATKGEYVPALMGKGKMSKSVADSYINLTDDLETINQRLAKTPTDTGKSIDKNTGKAMPMGVKNLLQLVALIQGDKRKDEYYQQYFHGNGIRYGQLKDDLAKAIYQELKPIQEKRRQLEQDVDYLDQVIEMGAKKARHLASETLVEVKEKMGLS